MEFPGTQTIIALEGHRSALRSKATRMRHDGYMERTTDMLWTLFLILLVMWALGMVTSYTLGGFIHILLIVALVVMIARLVQGRSVV